MFDIVEGLEKPEKRRSLVFYSSVVERSVLIGTSRSIPPDENVLLPSVFVSVYGISL